jgi:hypothetical protein
MHRTYPLAAHALKIVDYIRRATPCTADAANRPDWTQRVPVDRASKLLRAGSIDYPRSVDSISVQKGHQFFCFAPAEVRTGQNHTFLSGNEGKVVAFCVRCLTPAQLAKSDMADHAQPWAVRTIETTCRQDYAESWIAGASFMRSCQSMLPLKAASHAKSISVYLLRQRVKYQSFCVSRACAVTMAGAVCVGRAVILATSLPSKTRTWISLRRDDEATAFISAGKNASKREASVR